MKFRPSKSKYKYKKNRACISDDIKITLFFAAGENEKGQYYLQSLLKYE